MGTSTASTTVARPVESNASCGAVTYMLPAVDLTVCLVHVADSGGLLQLRMAWFDPTPAPITIRRSPDGLNAYAMVWLVASKSVDAESSTVSAAAGQEPSTFCSIA